MDNTKTITHLGLCAGYGGIELGIKRVIPALRTVALCEIEAFAVANLVSKMEAGLMDAAPVWTDLKTFPWEEFRDRVDILTGGYPCQPFSAAGKRLGGEDPRHLWPHLSRGISILQPRVCFFENVEGHISLGLSDVIEDLAGMGYRTTWGIFSASECGAPHQRKRVFIMGVNNCERLERLNTQLNYPQGWKIQNRPTCLPDGTARSFLSNAVRDGSGESWLIRQGAYGSESFSDGESRRTWPSRPVEQQYGWEPPRVVNSTSTTQQKSERQTQPSLGGDLDGSASGLDYAELSVSCDNRTDELRLLGNGVVPATAVLAFCTLMTDLCSPSS